jgi:hypothetical protein
MTVRLPAIAAALLALSLAGCASSFDSASKLKTLRILAVQKDKPYARPGDTVNLKLLFDDPRDPFVQVRGRDAGHRPFHVLWLSGCTNPKADAFEACIEQFTPDGGKLPSSLHGASDTLDFAVTLPKDIISSRPPPSNPDQPRNGSAFVFFALCAGELKLGGPNVFDCESASHELLGADDFVIGYSEIFAYDELTNANPVVATRDPDNGNQPTTGFQVDGVDVPVDCIGDACLALESAEFRVSASVMRPMSLVEAGAPVEGGLLPFDAGRPFDAGALPFGDGGLGLRDASARPADAGLVRREAGTSHDAGGTPAALPPNCDPEARPDARCFAECIEDDQDKCPKHSMNLVVTRQSAETDGVAEALEGRKVGEQMWINYYTDAGKLEHDVKLLNDATAGWNPNHFADLRTPQTLGTFHVWAVAHDNRGGAQWARVTLSTTSPYAHPVSMDGK